jgi:hypothetical protein
MWRYSPRAKCRNSPKKGETKIQNISPIKYKPNNCTIICITLRDFSKCSKTTTFDFALSLQQHGKTAQKILFPVQQKTMWKNIA